MLTELSMVEQRYLAVREALDSGATIVQVAAQYGVDRRTLHRWLTRYANGGLEALADRSFTIFWWARWTNRHDRSLSRDSEYLVTSITRSPWAGCYTWRHGGL